MNVIIICSPILLYAVQRGGLRSRQLNLLKVLTVELVLHPQTQHDHSIYF